MIIAIQFIAFKGLENIYNGEGFYIYHPEYLSTTRIKKHIRGYINNEYINIENFKYKIILLFKDNTNHSFTTKKIKEIPNTIIDKLLYKYDKKKYK